MKRTALITIALLLAIIASIFFFAFRQLADPKGSNEPQNTINTTIEPKDTAQIPETTPEEPKILESDLDTSTWKTYRNDEFGFEVKYPSEWGEIEINQGITCYDEITQKKLNLNYEKDSCTQAYFSVKGRMVAFIATNNARKHGPGRGAFWGDITWYEDGVIGSTLDTVCSSLKHPGDKNLQSCNYFKTLSGLKYIVTIEYNWGPEYALVYHIATAVKSAPVLSISLERTGMDATTQSEVLEKMIELVKIYPPR